MKNLLILAILGALLTVGLSHPPHQSEDPFKGHPLSHRPRPPMPPPDFVDFGEDAEFESDSSDVSDFSDNDDLEGERPLPPPFNVQENSENGEFLPPPPPHKGGHHGQRPPFGKHHGKHPRFRGPRPDGEGSNIAQNKESLKEVDIEGSFEHPRPPHHPHKFNKSEGPHHPPKHGHGHGKRHGGFDNEKDRQRGPGGRKEPHHKRGHKGPHHKKFNRKPEENNDVSFDDIARKEKLIKVVPVEKL